MENHNFCTINTLISDIVLFLTGTKNNCSSIIKVNEEKLYFKGELYFLSNIKAWKSFFKNTACCNKNCGNILQHFWNRKNKGDATVSNLTDQQIIEEALKLLLSTSKEWTISLESYALQKEKICLFLNRNYIIPITIKKVVGQPIFGNVISHKGSYNLKVQLDEHSELTNARLNLVQKVTSKILATQGYQVLDNDDGTYKIIFTTKSQGATENHCKKCVCGVVKNSDSNLKDTSVTWKAYVKTKTNQLLELNDFKINIFNNKLDGINSFIFNIAKAVATFELLTVKPCKPIICGVNSDSDKATTNTKGATFILYNLARITAILEKYREKEANDEVSALPDINEIDFAQLDEEDEWNLIFNYVMRYHDIIEDCIVHEPNFETNPQIICLFLLRMCQKFSIYYRHTRILTEGGVHLLPKMFARIYMLQALQIILRNGLAILGIDPVSRM
ncbi:DALR anticodon-binding domain-containing protein 3 [Prorops nasuta]|uniref:DALR anticodon-binding domain-containing protein 3 n=1 Tax=Prorops nasuta TaxID=863751 RepID=UPI0034CDF876